MREDLSGVLRQTDKKVELLWRQVGVLAAYYDTMLRNIDKEVARVDDLRTLRAGDRAAAQLCADAGLQLLNAEGLGDVVVGACVEGFHLHEVLVADREDNDGNL